MRATVGRLLAAVVTGVGVGVLLPPYDLGGLVWVVVIPLLVALWSLEEKRAGWKGFGLGWLAGMLGFLINLHWLGEVSHLGWVLLSAYLALFSGLWGALLANWANPWRVVEVPKDETGVARKIREKTQAAGEGKGAHWRQSGRSLKYGFVAAACWCGFEWLRGWLFTGFGWNGLGVAFHQTPVMAQSADLLGICGLAFVPVFLQAVIVQTGRRLWCETRAGKRRPHVDFGVAVLLVALSFCYGVWRIYSVGKGESIPLKVLLVQLDIPQDATKRLWSPYEVHVGYEEETLAALEAIEDEDTVSIMAAAENGGEVSLRTPDWIMWPESSLNGRILRSEDGGWGMYDENMQTLSLIRDAGEFAMILGLNEIEAEFLGPNLVMMENARVWNSLVVLTPEFELSTARKQHLVIFGEYIPLVEELPFLKKIYEQQAGVEFGRAFSKGESLDPMPVNVRGQEIGLIPSVCFEDTVPRLMRRFVRHGETQLIVNVTNDGWFKDSPAAAQHFANARFRAIELRRPMIRCANTGVSAAVNSLGSTAHPVNGERQELRDEKGNHLTRGWLLAELEIPKVPIMSLYATIGDSGVIVLGVCGLLMGFLGRRKNSVSNGGGSHHH